MVNRFTSGEKSVGLKPDLQRQQRSRFLSLKGLPSVVGRTSVR